MAVAQGSACSAGAMGSRDEREGGDVMPQAYEWEAAAICLKVRCDKAESECDALRAEVERLVGLVMELTDAGECWYDHHGLCQAHSLQERPCPHSRAKDLLKAKGALSGAGKEE